MLGAHRGHLTCFRRTARLASLATLSLVRPTGAVKTIFLPVPSYWPGNFRGMERLQSVDRLRRLGFEVPFEKP